MCYSLKLGGCKIVSRIVLVKRLNVGANWDLSYFHQWEKNVPKLKVESLKFT